MDLKSIRKYIDNLDKALQYIILQRMAIIPIVAEVKREQEIPLHQPEREEQMFKAMTLFSEEVGLNPELLIQVYKCIIKESLKIEHEDETINKKSQNENYFGLIDEANKPIKDFADSMDKLITELKGNNIRGEKISWLLTDYYKERIF